MIDCKSVTLTGMKAEDVIKMHDFSKQLSAYADAVQAICPQEGQVKRAVLLTDVMEMIELKP